MKERTEMMFTPSMEECVKAAVKLGMPESEGRKFFYHYESNGWKVGKLLMKSFAGAMGGWHERWLERGSPPPTDKFKSRYVNGPNVLSGADKVLLGDEYKRVLDRMKQLLHSYDSHLDMHPDDRRLYKKLAARREELRKILGITI